MFLEGRGGDEHFISRGGKIRRGPRAGAAYNQPEFLREHGGEAKMRADRDRMAWMRANVTKNAPRTTPKPRSVMYFAEVENYTDDMFAGLEGSTFRFRGNTYAIRNGDIYVLEGMAVDSLDGLGELGGFFKKLGRIVRAPIKLTKKLHNIGTKATRKFVKSKAGKIVIGVALAATGVGLVGMAAYGAAGIGAGISAVGSAAAGGIASGASAVWGGAKLVGGKVVGMFAKRGGGGGDTGISVPEPSVQAAAGAASDSTWSGGSASGWFTEANLKRAASLATTAVGAYGTYQAAKAQQTQAEAQAQAASGEALPPGYGPGGGYGGGAAGDRSGGETFPPGGLDTSLEPGGGSEIPDVTQYAGIGMPLLLLGGGLLLMMSMKRR